ncbi:MAG: CopD family protein [Candidatus Aminicenantes bacterium]|jgi:predicted heme/steroid binding protein/uncharacterized membrane protein
MKKKENWQAFVFVFLLFLFSIQGNSTEEYAEKTGKSCAHCHLDPSGSGELTKAGEDYLAGLLSEEDAGQRTMEATSRSMASKLFRLFIGYLHIITGIFWFGTILYVHLILKPAYAAHGLPRGEIRLGLVSMFIMGVTGTILTIYRVPSLTFLFETRFGILLLIKIILFLMMVLTALYVVIFLGPKLKKPERRKNQEEKGKFTIDGLRHFDGAEARSCYIGFRNKVYDMTGSEFWKNGIHFQRHKAGEDLSDMLAQAPHGEEKILVMPLVGELDLSNKDEKPLPEKIFYVLAYFNLGVVLLITLILALWRWW